jgi:uncharacterized protein Ymh
LVEIADVEAALEKVHGFIALVELALEMWEPDPPRTLAEQYKFLDEMRQVNTKIGEQLPLIRRIAERADSGTAAELAGLVENSDGWWPYSSMLKTSRYLVGVLGSVEEAERILGPAGPKLAAANLHPWIWSAAVSLWSDGYLREAVQAAASALFDKHLPEKLGVPPSTSAKDLIAQAFSTNAPTPANPRLRLADYPNASANWTSQNEGARNFGMGCAQLIRNLVTHGARPDEQTALEQLASLSLLARLIDRADKVTV